MIQKSELENLFSVHKSVYKVSKALGVSHTTIRRWADKYSIDIGNKYICKCGETKKENFSHGRHTECKACKSNRQKKIYRKYKQQAVDYKGGACIKCGYSKCIASLDFHHRNPDEKDINWKKLTKRSFKSIVKELDKCDLLCRNCHGEIHYCQSD